MMKPGFDCRMIHQGLSDNLCRRRGVCVVSRVSPLRGLLLFCFSTYGLRGGLHSCAASRLEFADSV
jgi:hypothetical protein